MTLLEGNRRLLIGLKGAISFGLLLLLFYLVDWKETGAALIRTTKTFLVCAPLLSLIGFWFAAFRWRLLLAANRVLFPLKDAYRGYLVGFFYGVFLPTGVGGDLIRITRCVRKTRCPISTATSIVFLERVSGIVALVGIMGLAAMTVPETVAPIFLIENTKFVFAVAIASVFGIALFVVVCRLLLRKFEDLKRQGWLPRLVKGLGPFGHTRVDTLIQVVGLSMLFQTTDIVVSFVLSLGMNISLPLPVFFIVVPIAYFATLLPVSLGGIGIREGTFVILLSRLGVSISDAMAFSLLVLFNRLIIAVFGGSVNLMETLKSHHRQPIDKQPER